MVSSSSTRNLIQDSELCGKSGLTRLHTATASESQPVVAGSEYSNTQANAVLSYYAA